jgi:ActR/RegA family two-component response regulator
LLSYGSESISRESAVRFIIVDAERPLRVFLATLLRTLADMDVGGGTAEDGPEAVSLILRERPHLALVDERMR